MEKTTAEILEIIKTHPTNLPGGWWNWESAKEAHRIASLQNLEKIPKYIGGYSGRGIVMCAGGRFFCCAYASIRIIRELGCNLPVEMWHLGPGEMDDYMRSLIEPYNVKVIDAYEVRKTHPSRILAGWEIKPYATIHSSFEELIFLDADCVTVKNPEYLFDLPCYQFTGSHFFPDRPADWSKGIENLFGIKTIPHEKVFETGQYVLNKEKCWKEINQTMWWNEHSDFTYRHIHGDKDTYHVAWSQCLTPYAMCDRYPDFFGGFHQFDCEGTLAFQHRNEQKLSLENNRFMENFVHEKRMHELATELRGLWSGGVGQGPPPKPEPVTIDGRQREFCVGITTFNQYTFVDRLVESILAGTAIPQRIIVIDNGGGYENKLFDSALVQVVKPMRNIGVSGAWNLIHQLTDPVPVVICNDDIKFGKTALEKIVDEEGDFVRAANCHYAVFKQNHLLWRTVGSYDEMFWPAYSEDDDYRYRMKLAGVEEKIIQVELWHGDGGTRYSIPDRPMLESFLSRNAEYYRLKWGGYPFGHEKYTKPFNNPLYNGQFPTPDDFRLAMFMRACLSPSDINEHLETICDYASKCDHVTEFGTREGNTTLALLNSTAQTVICYDIDQCSRFSSGLLRRMGYGKKMVLHKMDILDKDIEETDMLFIDTIHTKERFEQELKRHAPKVRKYIIRHDTHLFPDLMKVIDDLVETGQWEVIEHRTNNHGLTVLGRT
jgi:hypothetical protein